ncbi:MAG: pyruvate ferredoxin oxidoreductase [Candidatus Aminicenantes bacterium RBG_19FT_COMBO_58_17]|nr:MAG: pyruvate ferredoxin oxidoreductase [Candidatus Aminicenantes bacterium RBG_19FT_COMBO_58_17]HCS47253.1 pyruvate ferredoxin oxidoreductase [Candidatus Aminicenantes bacterium]
MKATKILNGNQTIAEAARQIDPDVIAAYPITPSTAIVETIASFRADGLIKGEFVCPESEHSAMSVCIGAASAGGRVMTATSSQGLALMWEMLYIAAGLRLPIVAAIANRALSAPINIHGDHSDTMGARDSGWIQIYSEDCQEAYDNFIQAFRIGEHPDVLTPVLVGLDGFIISHSSEVVQVEDDAAVKKFIGEFKPPYPLLDTSRKFTVGPIDFTDYYFEHKRSQIEGIENSPRVIEEVGKEFGRTFGRKYGFFEEYRTDDAELCIVVMSSAAGTGKDAVDELRAEGKKIGLLKPRVFRPFPYRQIAEALKKMKAVAVLDRSSAPGAFGAPLFTEVRSALYDYEKRPKMVNYVYGLGGRDIKVEHFKEVARKLEKIAATGKVDEMLGYINLRE